MWLALGDGYRALAMPWLWEMSLPALGCLRKLAERAQRCATAPSPALFESIHASLAAKAPDQRHPQDSDTRTSRSRCVLIHGSRRLPIMVAPGGVQLGRTVVRGLGGAAASRLRVAAPFSPAPRERKETEASIDVRYLRQTASP